MAKKKNSNDGNKKGLSGPQVALILGCVAIVCTAALAAVYMLSSGDDLPSDSVITDFVPPPLAATHQGALIVTEENLHTIGQEVRERVERGMFVTHMNTTWNFPDGYSASSDAVKGNSPDNNFAFWFTVTLAGTDHIVYTSGLIPVGAQLSEIILDDPLPQGTYDAVININMIDDDGVPVDNNMGIALTIVVRD